jgi:hypothetical protein
MSFSLQEEIAELERERTALLQKLNAAQEFWTHVEAMLDAHHVNTVQDLPDNLRQSLLKRFTCLPHEGQMQLALMRLERKEAELTNLLAELSGKSKDAA